MKIGEIAKAVNCHVETVRYYEKEGLLPPCNRAPNGYGEYSETHLKLLRLIRYSKGLGFPQEDIRVLVHIARNKNISCNEAHRLVLVQIDKIKEKINLLTNLQNALTQISKDCKRNNYYDCTLIDEIMESKR